MKPINTFWRIAVLCTIAIMSLTVAFTAFAATTPASEMTATYSILSSTYTNTLLGTTINGDIGFTTGPAVVPAGVHNNYGTLAPYAVAGVNQGTILTALAWQPCTYTFAAGAVNLATDVGHGTIGIYTPWVYCTTAASAASIGTAGITLDGAGTYIFRVDGAFDTVANASVTLSGASSCDVFWAPTGATTLGANSIFAGTVIDSAGITIGSNVTWDGRALAFGGTVTTAVGDTITAPICGVTPATLHVIKQVVNTGGGTAPPSAFSLHVKLSGVDVTGSPASGSGAPWVPYTLVANAYGVDEEINTSYTQSFSGDCSSTGSIILFANQDKTCTIINTYIPVIIPPVSTGGGWWGSSIMQLDNCPGGDYSSSYYDGICGVAPIVVNTGTIIVATTPVAIVIAAQAIVPTPLIRARSPPVSSTVPIIVHEIVPTAGLHAQITPFIPLFPHTGVTPEDTSTPWPIMIFVSIFAVVLAMLVMMGFQ